MSCTRGAPAGPLVLTLPLTFDACAYHICKLQGIAGESVREGERENEREKVTSKLKFSQHLTKNLPRVQFIA